MQRNYDDCEDMSLGDILRQALDKKQETGMRVHIKTETKQVQTATHLRVPLWMEYALSGQKINAIKELREFAGIHPADGAFIGLAQAKKIVESVTSNLVTDTQEVT